MIHYLSQKYYSFFKPRCSKSDTRQREDNAFLYFQFIHAERVARIFTYGWLIYQTWLYIVLSDRPDILYTPTHFLGQLLAPVFPSPAIYSSILIATFVCNTLSLCKIDSWLTRAFLFLGVLYLNNLNWNYGGFSHVGHLFVLFHFFTIFISDHDASDPDTSQKELSNSVRWAYIGFMSTYTIAGIWKITGLIARFTFSTYGISWLSNNAALYNSIIGHKSWDLPLDSLTVQIFTIPYLWPIMFLIMLILQLTSFLATIRLPLFFWIGFGSIGFHIFNLIFMKIEFIITPIMLLILFFPYHKLFKKRYSSLLIPIVHTEFTGHRLTAFYKRVYQNNETDIFTGFYAYREYLYDREKWYAGLLFIPGLASLCSLCWKYLTRKGREKTKERGEHASVPAD